MKTSLWHHAAEASADPARARHGFKQLAAESGSILEALSEEHARILAALFAGSQAMSVLLLRHPEWSNSLLTPDNLAHPRREQGLRREVNAWLEPALQARDYAGAFA